jgi:hypothetical protein
MVQKAEKVVPVDRFQEAIDLHRKKGIQTYTLTCVTGEKCLIREPDPFESAAVLPILQGMGYDNNGKMREPSLLEAGQKIISECWISGDDKIRKDKNLMAEVSLAAANLIDLRIADVKKN